MSRYCILGTLWSSFLYRFLRLCKHGFARHQQGVQGDRMLHINFFVWDIWGQSFHRRFDKNILLFHAHKKILHDRFDTLTWPFDVGKWNQHHRHDRLIIANCAGKSVFHHGHDRLIFVCCDDKFDFLFICNKFIWACHVNIFCFLCTFFRCPNILNNALSIVQFVCCF